METALEVAKERGARIPAIAMMVFGADCKSDGGLAPAESADRLIAAGADVVGGNCGIGPSELYQGRHESMVGRGKPVIADVQPNAGLPASVEGRTLYVANPEHFGVFARRMLKSGVRVVGGCCGTTPDHTRAMLGAVRMLRGEKLDERATKAVKTDLSIQIAAPKIPARPAQPARRERIAAGEVRRVGRAVGAPRAPATWTSCAKQQVGAGRSTAASTSSTSRTAWRASARVANIAVCARLSTETAVEPILHVCARDTSFLGLIAHLQGAHALGLRDLG